MPMGKVLIYRLLLVSLFVCTVTDFSGEDIAIAASDFASMLIFLTHSVVYVRLHLSVSHNV